MSSVKFSLLLLVGLSFVVAAAAQTTKSEPTTSTARSKDTTKDTGKEDPKLHGKLPKYWKQLGLNKDQELKAAKFIAKYDEEVAALKAKIEALKEAHTKELAEILTDEQKKHLEEIYKSKAGTEMPEKTK